MNGWRWWGVGGTVCLFVAVGWSFAQRERASAPVESLLPQDAVVFYSIDGADKHRAAYEGTAAHDAIVKSGLWQALEETINRLGGFSPQAQQLREILGFIEAHGLSLAITVDPPQQGPPLPWGVLVLHDAGRFRDVLDQYAQLAGEDLGLRRAELRGRMITAGKIPDSPLDIAWWAEKGHLLIFVGLGGVGPALDLADGNRAAITEHRYWKAHVQAEAGYAVNQRGWLDTALLQEMFGAFPLPPMGGAAADKEIRVRDILNVLGLEQLQGVLLRSGYDGRSLVYEQMIDAPGPRKGLLSLIDQEAITLQALPRVPVSHNGLLAVSCDLEQAFVTGVGMFREFITLVDPRELDDLEQALGQLDSMLGIRLQQDLLASLGHIHCLYADSTEGSFGLGSVAALSVQDARKLDDSLRRLLAQLAAISEGEVVIRTVNRQDKTLTVLNFPKVPLVTPTFGIDGNWLAIGLNSQSVEAFFLRQAGQLPAWEPAAQTAAAIPAEFTSLSVVDPRDGVKMLLGTAPTVVGLMEVGMRESGVLPPGFPQLFDSTLLPPAELVTLPLFPNVSYTTADNNGHLSYSKSSLPGVPLAGGSLGGSTGVATTGIAVALLLPAVQAAREAARRTQSANNLKQIGLAMHNYHDTFGHFPAGDIPNDNLAEDERLSWIVSILPYLEQAALYNQIDAKSTWNSNSNRRWTSVAVPVLLHPGINLPQVGDAGATHYVGLAGLGEKGPTLASNEKGAGMFAYGKPRRFRDILDGTSNTVAVAEATDNPSPWAQAKGSIRPLTQQPYLHGPDGIGGPSRGGTNMLFGDGAVRFVSDNIDPRVMEALVTIAGGEVVDDF